MDYTPEETAFLNTLFDSYQDILEATVAVIGTSSNPSILYLAVDTLADMAEEIDEVNQFFQMAGITPTDSDAMTETQDAASPYMEMMAQAKKDSKTLKGVFIPKG